ncbi:permease [Clostridium formicaceticum]|uniref:Permease n=1 Tax=Clostridium formicaceticum TaxID=1497 RepID=A0AAC9RQT4_9CLOT|nr:permease [Clostridium formicaceticum]AOY74976.1 permease [Clostridium formicaceticum]ARE89388.1 putative permease [Clostridium formicaceticum]
MVLLKKYRFFLTTTFIMLLIFLINKEMAAKAMNITGYSFKEMILVIPPVFVLLGLLDVWVPKEIMMKYMGEKSGVKGIVLAIILGSAAAGPLYGAFPIAAVFMKKGVKFSNVLIFIGAWSTTKIPMFLFELSALGGKFAITRLLVDIPGIILMAYILCFFVDTEEIKRIYENAEAM